MIKPKSSYKRKIAKASKMIKEAILTSGPYTHNLISYVLRALAYETSYKQANMLVRKFKLTKLFGINEYDG